MRDARPENACHHAHSPLFSHSLQHHSNPGPAAHASRRLHDSPAAPGDDVETLIALLEGRPVITQDAQAAAGAIIFRAIEGQRAAGPWVASAAQAQASTVAVLAGLDLYIQVNGCTEPVIEAIKGEQRWILSCCMQGGCATLLMLCMQRRRPTVPALVSCRRARAVRRHQHPADLGAARAGHPRH